MDQSTYFFASFSYGEEARLFGDEEEIERELASLAEAEREAKERLLRVRAAVRELNELTCAEKTDADARVRILDALDAARAEAETLLCSLAEKRAQLKEEWEDARFALGGALPQA